jgi:hypothetical protein
VSDRVALCKRRCRSAAAGSRPARGPSTSFKSCFDFEIFSQKNWRKWNVIKLKEACIATYLMAKINHAIDFHENKRVFRHKLVKITKK